MSLYAFPSRFEGRLPPHAKAPASLYNGTSGPGASTTGQCRAGGAGDSDRKMATAMATAEALTQGCGCRQRAPRRRSGARSPANHETRRGVHCLVALDVLAMGRHSHFSLSTPHFRHMKRLERHLRNIIFAMAASQWVQNGGVVLQLPLPVVGYVLEG